MNQYEKINIHSVFSGYFPVPEIKNIAYLVSQKLEEGNICLDIGDYNKNEAEKINIDTLSRSPWITTAPHKEVKPFVLLNNKLYLHRYFYYETVILNTIKSLISNSDEDKTLRKQELLSAKPLISNLFHSYNQQTNWQLISALLAYVNDFFIITGGPGTGKTTIITKLLAIIFELNPEFSVAIAAPTGKATARLNESISNLISNLPGIKNDTKEILLDIKAQTVHRLLGYGFNTPYFKHNKENPLQYDLVIVDESSMIDVALMAKLMEAIRKDTKLILLGDKNQLASVEAGSIFGDLCKTQKQSNTVFDTDIDFLKNFNINIENNAFYSNILTGKIIELQHSYRFDITEGIGKFSNLVISGNSSEDKLITPFLNCKNQSQCVEITADYQDDRFYKMIKLYEDYARENDIEKAFEKLKKIIILCAVREGQFGMKHYNSTIEDYLKSKALISPSGNFYDKQVVMVTSNDYNLGVFNGDIGIIRVDKNTDKKIIYFKNSDGSLKSFPATNINSFETAYAMTIHKSQGSEYDNVIIVIPDDENHRLLSRELLYTAVTRAKQNVLILGKSNIIKETVKNRINRISGINERIINQN